MEAFTSVISILSSVLGLIVTLGVILCTTIPNIRKKIKESFAKDEQVENIEKQLREVVALLEKQQRQDETFKADLELSREADLCLVRDRITHIYYKNLNKKTIKTYELENISKLYSLYEKLGGNSYVRDIVRIMKDEWDITT